jgi:Flp pilus assembly pilin Flp
VRRWKWTIPTASAPLVGGKATRYLLKNLILDEEAANMAEYAIMAAVIAAVVFAAAAGLGPLVTAKLNAAVAGFQAAGDGAGP